MQILQFTSLTERSSKRTERQKIHRKTKSSRPEVNAGIIPRVAVVGFAQNVVEVIMCGSAPLGLLRGIDVDISFSVLAQRKRQVFG